MLVWLCGRESLSPFSYPFVHFFIHYSFIIPCIIWWGPGIVFVIGDQRWINRTSFFPKEGTVLMMILDNIYLILLLYWRHDEWLTHSMISIHSLRTHCMADRGERLNGLPKVTEPPSDRDRNGYFDLLDFQVNTIFSIPHIILNQLYYMTVKVLRNSF